MLVLSTHSPHKKVGVKLRMSCFNRRLSEWNCLQRPLENTELLIPSGTGCTFHSSIKKKKKKLSRVQKKSSTQNKSHTSVNKNSDCQLSRAAADKLFIFAAYSPSSFTFPDGRRQVVMMKNHSDRRFQNVDTLRCRGPAL